VEALPSDAALVGALDSILSHKTAILRVIENYSGASEEVKAALSSQTEQAELVCFSKLLENVEAISNIFNYSLAFEQILPPAIHTLCGSPNPSMDLSTRRSIAFNAVQSKTALLQRIIELFAYVITFDNVRMMRPLVANDFSYYRRMLPKYHSHPAVAASIKVHDDDASVIALFTALHNPVFSAVLKSLKTAADNAGVPLECLPSFGGSGVNTGPGIGGGDLVKELLATVANTCHMNIKKALEHGGSAQSEGILQAARAMSVAATLYDHVSVAGVFSKKATVRIRDIADLLLKHFGFDPTIIGLLKYSTRTLKHAPTKMQELFE
jgi:hypothetical protein